MEIQQDKFVIVGIGASAGGLEAINDFFDHISSNTGMAFIVMQHLSPDFKSLMDELLAKHTNMPIKVVRENTPVKPNHIYLISKESNIIIKDGLIKPVVRQNRHVVNLPIDEFFHSLGESHRELSIGVILSGTGTDGSRGIGTIKEAGGMVFVQSPESAQFDGMPRSAIDTGLPDNILSPSMIAKSLMGLVKSKEIGYLLFLNPDDEMVQSYFMEILAIVKRQIGVDFEEYRQTTLYRRIEKRMFLNRYTDIEDYTDFLQDNVTEIENLYKEFLIGVTRFFRDTEAFDLLDEKVISSIIASKKPNEPIRIWVPSCSTGEEVYSIAILIQEYLRNNKLIREYKIFASDLDARAISIAGMGIYKKNIVNEIGIRYSSQYFTENGNGDLVISKKIRDKIVFTVHDALNDPPFINLDLVSCRNFMIYLKPEIQQRLLISFQFSLNYKGYLFLGSSESLGQVKSAFKSISDRWNIYQNILKTKLSPPTARSKEIFAIKKSRRLVYDRQTKYQTPMLSSSSQEAYSNWLFQHFVPICLFVNDSLEVLYINGDAEMLLNFPKIPGSFNLSTMLEEDELLVFKNGIRKTLENKKTNVYNGINYKKRDKTYQVNLKFQPAQSKNLKSPTILVQIEIIGEGKVNNSKEDLVIANESTYQKERLRTLEMELKETKTDKKELVERLETITEELQSSNEELLAANEELQSTNEELQSVNEELYTVNSELHEKVNELTIANSDMDNLLKATGIGTIFIDEKLNIRKFTPAVKEQFKLVDGDIGRPITTFVNSFGGKRIYDDFKKVAQKGIKIEREVRDDNGRPFLMRLLPYQLSNDKTNGVVASFINVGDLKKATQEVNYLATLFQAIFTHAETHITILNKKFEIDDVNFVPTEYNLSREEVIGKSFLDFLPPSGEESLHQAIINLETQDSVTYSVPVPFPDDSVRWFENTVIALKNDWSEPKYLIISRDETQFKNIEQSTRMNAHIFEGIFKYAKEHILILDKEGMIQQINYTAEGYERKNLVGKKLAHLIPPDSQQNFKNGIQSILNRNEESFEYDTENIAPNGENRIYTNVLFPIIMNKEIERIILISRDVSSIRFSERDLQISKKNLEKQLNAGSQALVLKNLELEEINTYLDSFVHGAAHDLRSPLTQMKGYLTILPEIENKDDRNSATEELMESAVRMERILNGLIELIDFKKNAEPTIKTFNLWNVYQETIDNLMPYINKTGAEFTTDIPKDLSINYIGAYLSSIFFNLIHNAIKYRSFNRKLGVNVSIREENEFIILTISDNGIGMNLQKYGHFLFKPFKRLTVEREGTGIGLSIINNSVRRNGGRIDVKSFVNQGTTFTVYLKSYPLN